ncbi:glutathione peroxidase [Artemisia annua]|uniref:Glutathione peroxidase n=1 Tax=Artemisia annua TaxID=35608 RepID=A0A2U1MJ56_ARTAN|nr:glutathione peroxidase [Artemisia annua]
MKGWLELAREFIKGKKLNLKTRNVDRNDALRGQRQDNDTEAQIKEKSTFLVGFKWKRRPDLLDPMRDRDGRSWRRWCANDSGRIKKVAMDIFLGLTGSDDGLELLGSYSRILLPALLRLLGEKKIYNHGTEDSEILDFPCNQFLWQEPGTNEEIQETMCTRFKAEFPIFDKVDVNGNNAAPLYKYLKSEKSGFISEGIKLNFTKFLLNKEGKFIARYGSSRPE